MVLLSIYNIFLSKLSNQEVIVVGTPTAGRRHADLEKVIGMFVNTLAMKNSPAGEKPFLSFLGEVKEKTLNAFANQDYQYEELVEKVMVNRDTGRNPLFDTMFMLQNMVDSPVSGQTRSSLNPEPYPFEKHVSKFDLSLGCVEMGDCISCTIEYGTSLFKRENILRFAGFFKKIVTAVAASPDAEIASIEIISPEEREKILYDFNDTEVDYPGEKTITHLFEQQAERRPGAVAVKGNGGGSVEMRYGQLNEKADRLAAYLIAKGVMPDTIVGLKVERRVEMFIGLLGILKAGAAYLPIDPVYPQERIDYMLKESNTKYLLTTDEILTVCTSAPELPSQFTSKQGTLAYVIYTSGSSGRPKGVAVEHGNVLNFITGMTGRIDFSAGKRILAVTTICFDIFVLESFLPLLQGMEIVLADETEQGDPLLLMPLIEDNGVDMVQFTPSRLQLVINISPGLRFLQGVKELLVGGEALPPHLFETLKQHYRGKIYNVYGPTETTVWSTVKDLTASREITIGTPIANTQIYILSNNQTLQPIGIAGELCIGGAGVARGYLNRPGLTDEKFFHASGGSPRGRFCKSSAKLLSWKRLKDKRLKDERLYRTGDLARWLGDGDIECLGRIDNQVKIRGFRIELGEIENQLLSNEKVKETVVIAGNARSDGDKYLCAYIVFHESAGQVDASELRSYLVDRLPGYMLPSYFVSLPEMPLTPNGKLNGRGLPDPETGRFSDNYVPPRNAVETKLVHIWSCLLSIEEEKIGIHDNFFGMGGHSLKVTGMAARIEKEFGVKIKMAQVFKSPTISGLSQLIEKSAKSECVQIELVEEREYYPLSSAQKRMYFIHEMDGGTGYNMPGIMTLEGEVDAAKLENIFSQLVERHESFRTSFHMVNEQPAQRIQSTVSPNLFLDKSFADQQAAGPNLKTKRPLGEPPEAWIRSFIRPFDLSQAPLLRVGLVELGDNQSLLMVDMHHIISDGISLELLVKEFMVLYSGDPLPAVPIRYRDYAWNQYHGKRSEQLLQQEQYWIDQFQGEIPVLSLPTDYMRPVVRDFAGDRVDFSLDSRTTAGIKALAFQSGSTLFIVLTAIYNLFLAKAGNQEDIVIGTPTSGRRHADLETVIGMFVNTVALRNFPVGEKRFGDFLAEVKEKTFAAFENQEYQYEELIDKLEIRRDTGRNPLFDTLFTLRNIDEGVVEIPGLKISPLDWESGTTKFDLSLSGVETGDELSFTFRYCTKLFKRETIDTFILFFKEIASSVTVNPGQTLYEARAIPSNRKQELLLQMNRRIREGFQSPIRPVVSLQEKLRESFDRFGSSVAVQGVEESFSYRFLDHQSSAIADVLLVEKSVEAGTMIGVLMENRLKVIFALLAILKARCIFVPLNPALPEQRRQTMIDSLGLELILTGDDIPLEEMRSIEHRGPDLAYSLEDPVYVYFTSGSTGVPRALLGKNSSLLHFIQWEIHRFNIDSRFRFSQVITPVFDAFLRDVFAPLCSGGVICIPPSHDTSGQLVSWLNRAQVNLVHCVPAFFRSLIAVGLDAGDFKSLRYILMSGEPVVPADLAKWYRVFGGRVQLANLWGPSETTLIKSGYLIDESDCAGERVPVGLPMEGSCTLVLDDQGGLCDTLVVGELYIRTPFGTAGYLNDPLSNRRKFVPLPAYLDVDEAFERETGLPDLLHKTGDLGRLLPNGMIDVLGRNDRQVKIRGIRVELGEIEGVMMKYRGVEESVVTFKKLSGGSSGDPGQRLLCAYITSSSGEVEVQCGGLKNYLRGVLPDYMVPVHIMRLESIPRKANLKVDYDGLPHPLELESERFQAPRTETESRVRELWADLLGVEADNISVDRLFFELGGNSLSIMTLNSRIHREFNVRLPLAAVFGNATIEKLAVLLDGAGEEVYRAIVPVEQRDYYPLSSAQRRLYFLQMMEGGTGYNMPRVMRLVGKVDVDRIEETFKSLIRRHESFRTSFHMVNEEPAQRIQSPVSFNLFLDRSFAELFQKRPLGEPPEAWIRAFIRPFDLSQVPLLRVGLVEIGEGEYLFMVDMHHIISDGTSMGVLVGEFMTLYDGGQLPSLRLHYKDYAQWESERKEQIRQQESFWLNEFSGEIPVLDLPLDYRRPAVRDFSGDVVRFELSVDETDALNSLALEQGVTLYMVLLTIYNIFLGRVSNRETIVVGTPTAGRRHADLEKVIGMFVNTLALKSVVSADRPFLSLLAEVKEKTLSAFSNQDYQYEELVDKVMSTRDAGRNPLFDTMFILQNMESSGIETSSLKLGPFSHERHISKFDLSLICRMDDRLYCSMEYSTALFKQETIHRFITYLRTIITSVLKSPADKISALEMVSEAEREELLFNFNDTAGDYPRDKTIHQLFAEQAERTPDHIALSGYDPGGGFPLQVSYGELARRAYSLSCYLRAEGVGADTIVGLSGESCAGTVVGILGILMAGAAYLPINPNLPPVRMEYILKDSAVPVLLSYNNPAVSFDKKVILLEDEKIYTSDPLSPAPVSLPHHAAYVIYTSGSTGWPKGVAVEHRQLVNFITHMANRYDHGIGVWDRCLSLTNIMFDVSVWEFFLPLSFGARLVFMAGQETFDVYALVRVIPAEGITLLYLPPGLLKPVYELLQNHRDQLSLNKMLVGVEPIRGEVLDDYISLNPGMQIVNGYGPTETTICCTTYRYSPVDLPVAPGKGEIVPIGLPLANSQVVLLGGGDVVVPGGIAGEICVSGACVSRGYINNPELTAEKYTSHPHLKGKRMYRTGDMARWLADGTLRFLGRRDTQLKIRGYRIELGEIEKQLLSHDRVTAAVLRSFEDGGGDKYLCAYFVDAGVDTGVDVIDAPALKEYLADRLPGYMVPAYFVAVEKIPLTANGKVDINALPLPQTDQVEVLAGPRNQVEKQMVEIWSRVLGKESIGIHDDFFSIGGDSIKSIQIISRMNRAGYKVEMKEIFQYPAIAQLSAHVKPLKRVSDQHPITGIVPLTPIQHSFFKSAAIDPHHFNQAVMFHSKDRFDKESVIRVFTRIQEHHDALRMTYTIEPDNGEVKQVNHGPDYPLSLEEFNLEHPGELDEKVNRLQSSIDLEKGPLMKLGLFHMDDGDRLLVVIHHLVVDGVSWRILFEDIDTLYRQILSGSKPALPLKSDSFKYWSEKLRDYARDKKLLQEISYWNRVESQAVRVIKRDFDAEGNAVKDTRRISFVLDEKKTALLLNKVNRCYGTEINDILLTALGMAVSRLTAEPGPEAVPITLEGHGREEIFDGVDISRTVGWFTTLYPVLLDMSYAGDTGRRIMEVKETLRKIPNKGIGYGIIKHLTKDAGKEKTFNSKPQIIFNYLGQFDTDVKGFKMAEESSGRTQGPDYQREHDLEISGMIANNCLSMNLVYNETHFRAQTIEMLADNFHRELEHLIAFCSAKESIRRTPSDFTYKELTIERLNRLMEAYGGTEGHIEDIYPLSPMQEGMLFHSLADNTSAAYFQQTAFRLQGPLDIPVVEKSVNQLLLRHPVLRTAFVHKDCPRPLQVVLKERPVDFYYRDIRLMGGSEEKEGFVREFKARDKKKTFNLSDDTLVRVSILRLDTEEYEFTWSFHHILMDGWCIGILNEEFFEIYSSNLENRSYGLPQAPPPYRTYIQWLEKQDKESPGQYWENLLAGFEEQTHIVPGVQADGKSGYNNQGISFTLDKDKTAKLNNLASGSGVTLNILNQAVWGILLGKYNGKEDIVFGTVVSGRPSDLEGVEAMVGLFINTIPVRIRFEENMKFHTLLQKVQQEALSAEPHHHYPLAAIQSRTPLKQGLMDHLLVFENYPVAEQIEGYEGKNENGALITNVDVFEQTTYHFNILLAAAGHLRITFKYNANVVEEEYVNGLVRHYQLLLEQVTDNDDVSIDQLTLLSPEDKERILHEFNDTSAPYPRDKTIDRLFEEQVLRTPDHIALLGPDGTNMSCLTYGHLNERADQLAARLIEKGVRPGGIVAIMVDRTVDMITGSLAILKAGGCYMPINPSYPQERIDFLLKNSNACYCLDSEDYRFRRSYRTHRTHRTDSNSSEPAYIMHTSGSTGNPKGVIVSHRNVVRLVKNTGYVEFVAGEKILQTGALDFDASTFEMWGALLNGLSLILVDKMTILTPQKFKWCLEAYDVATIWLTTGLFSRILQEDITVFSGLTNLLVGGDVTPTSHMNRLRRAYPRLNIINGYGPTENTTFSTTWRVLREYDRHVPIGKPIANSTAYVLDKNDRLQAVGIPGQLALGGDGVASGYLNSPELTAETFVFCQSIGDRIYKSGDRARWLADGTIEFLGRIDEQVKIRGFRIEPGEIEEQLYRYPAIKEAVVTARKEDGRKYLCAYYTLNSGMNVDKVEIKEYLEKTLPAYMVPASFVKLESIPLNPNGKVYRGKLPRPTNEDFISLQAFQAPATHMQRTIAAVWKEILGRERIGIRDNFFELGGNSLDLVALSNKLRQKLNREIPVAALIDNPTITSLEHFLTGVEPGVQADVPGVQANVPGVQANGPNNITIPENLVLLNSSPQAKANLFMVHPMFGKVGDYMEFSKQLNIESNGTPGFNIWGVESEIRSHNEPINSGIETIAAGYIRQIKTIQPHGPYNLTAWSWGGHILFEMALQLEKMGEEISLLAFLDCFGPDYLEDRATMQFILESEKALLREFIAAHSNEGEEIDDVDQLWSRTLEILTANPELVTEVRPLITEHAPALPDYDRITAEELVRFLNTARIHSRAGSTYVPERKIKTTIDYFQATLTRNKDQNWQEICINPIVYHEIEADHHSLFKNKEHLIPFAAKFKELLLASLKEKE